MVYRAFILACLAWRFLTALALLIVAFPLSYRPQIVKKPPSYAGYVYLNFVYTLFFFL